MNANQRSMLLVYPLGGKEVSNNKGGTIAECVSSGIVKGIKKERTYCGYRVEL